MAKSPTPKKHKKQAGASTKRSGKAAATPVTVEAMRPTRARADSKQARLIEMLKRPEGATVVQIADAFGWQTHTVRGALSGALKKKLGLAVTSEKLEGGARLYRITASPSP